jgi:hypothetical protein
MHQVTIASLSSIERIFYAGPCLYQTISGLLYFLSARNTLALPDAVNKINAINATFSGVKGFTTTAPAHGR